MTSQSPALALEARANREHAKLARASDELHMLAGVVKHCDLPAEMKLRLFAALRAESEMLAAEQGRIDGMREAAALSRGKQWVTSGDEVGA